MRRTTKKRRLFWGAAFGFFALSSLGLSMLHAAEVMQCQPYPDGDVQDVPIADDLMHPNFVSRLDWSRSGLAYAICSGKDLYFVAKTGRFIQAFNFDNGPDYFSKEEGLARYIGDNGLIGFVDRNLNIVLPAKYASASAFEAGLAKVSFPDGVSTTKGWINTNGEIVHP